MTLYVPGRLLEQIWAHAEASYPEEGAGVLLGSVEGEERWAKQLLPFANHFAPESRHNRYLIDPRDMLRAEEEAERLGLDVIGVFHSHPGHPARPSEFDREWALPWYSYVITSVQGGKAVESRSWRLTADRQQMQEEPLQVQQDQLT